LLFGTDMNLYESRVKIFTQARGVTMVSYTLSTLYSNLLVACL